jgi:hypothetical protein
MPECRHAQLGMLQRISDLFIADLSLLHGMISWSW